MDLQEVGWSLGLDWSGLGLVADICKCGNEISGSIKSWDLLASQEGLCFEYN